MREERARRHRTVAGRSSGGSGGSGRKLKFASPFDDGNRHFGERANICRWIGGLKGRQIRTLVDSQGIGIASSEGEIGRVIPFRDISIGGVKNTCRLHTCCPGEGKGQKFLDRRETPLQRRGGKRPPQGRGEGRPPEEADDRQQDPL